MFRQFHKIILGVTVICCFSNAYAQQLKFDQYTTADGLQSDRVYTLHMDSRGYVWACTNYGIAKFNGREFIPVCTNIPFREHFAYCMYENKRGDLWFVTPRANIYKIRNDSAFEIAEFEKVKELQKNAPDINKFFVDDSGDVYLSSNVHAYKLVCAEGYKIHDLNEYYNKDSVDFMLIRNEQDLLLLKKYPDWPKDRTLFTYKIVDGHSISKKHTVEIKNKAAVRLAAQFAGSLILTAGNECIIIGKNGDTSHAVFQHTILALAVDRNGQIWVGLDQEGLYKLNKKGSIEDHYFPETSVNSILFDDQSGLWISTAGHGIYHCKNINNTAFLNYPELLQPVSMIKKIDSIVFIGTPEGKLFKIAPRGKVEEIDLQDKATTMITDLEPIAGGFYLGCKNAVFKTNADFTKMNLVTAENKLGYSSLDLECDKKGNWYSLSRTNIFKIDNTSSHLAAKLFSKGKLLMYFQKDTFLVGTSSGLFAFVNDSVFVPPYLQRFSDVFINQLIRTPNRDLWICTVGEGIYQLKPDHKIIAYPEIPADVINDIFFVNDTTLGLCLNTGIFISTLSKLHTPKDWYQLHNEESASPLLVGDKLYVATNSGLQSFDLGSLKVPITSKLFFVKAVTNDSVFSLLPLTFNREQNKIDFHFDLLNYGTHKQRLFYELTGELKENGFAEGTTVMLSNLSPGNYTLTVRSAVSPLHMEEKGVIIPFFIEPAFWQTTWFMAGIIVTVILLLIFFIYFLNNRIKNKERQKAEVIRLLAEYKLTALKAQINPHFISNSLSAIQQLILDDQSDKAGQYLAKFSLLIRYVLKYSDRSLVKLREELEVIDLNIELEALRFKGDFEIQKVLDKNIDPENINIPPLITQPFIENAIWHGLLPLKGKRKPRLIIKISKNQGEIVIQIEDNGVGRTQKNNSERESRGMKLISNRLETINLLLGVKTAKHVIEDLLSETGEQIGTRVIIIIPDQFNTNEYGED